MSFQAILPPSSSVSSVPFLSLLFPPLLPHIDHTSNFGFLDSTLELAGSCPFYKFGTTWSFSSLCSHSTFLLSTFPGTLGIGCFKGHSFSYISELALPKVMYWIFCNPYTLQLSLLCPSLSIPFHTFLLAPPLPLLCPPSHATISLISIPRPITSLKDTCYSSSCFCCTFHNSFFLLSALAMLLPSLATVGVEDKRLYMEHWVMPKSQP